MHNRIMELLKDKFWMTGFLLFVNPIYANTNAFAKFLIFHGFHPWYWELCKDDCSKARVLGALYTPRARHAADASSDFLPLEPGLKCAPEQCQCF